MRSMMNECPLVTIAYGPLNVGFSIAAHVKGTFLRHRHDPLL